MLPGSQQEVTCATAPAAPPDERWFGHAVTLALGTFAVGTDAFVVAGLLPAISRSLSVDVAAAGQVVSVFSLAYALLSPVLAALTGAWSRRTVLVTALLVFAAGNVLTALAPTFGLVLACRVLAAAGAAMFTPTASATAAVLAGDGRRGRAIAVVTAGLTCALTLGAPLGSAVGEAWGWRATMWCVAGLTVLVLPAIGLRLPETDAGPAAGLRQRLAPLADRRVVRVLLVTLLAFVAIYLPYTYLSAVFAAAVGDGGRLALLLVAYGLAGTAGNLVAGRLADRHGPQRVVLGATLALAVLFLAVLPARGSMAAALAVLTPIGVASWSVTVPQQHRVIALAPPGAASLLVSLNAAVIYLASSLAGVVGGIGLHVCGSAAVLPAVAAVVVTAAALASGVAARTEPRPAGPGTRGRRGAAGAAGAAGAVRGAARRR